MCVEWDVNSTDFKAHWLSVFFNSAYCYITVYSTRCSGLEMNRLEEKSNQK